MPHRPPTPHTPPRMPTEDGHLLRLQGLVEALDTHIARLGLQLNLPLQHASGLQQALHGLQDAATSPRDARQLMVLRGLLVLRCDLVAKSVEDVGIETTLQVLIEAERHLVAHGFAPGADGIDLDTLSAPG